MAEKSSSEKSGGARGGSGGKSESEKRKEAEQQREKRQQEAQEQQEAREQQAQAGGSEQGQQGAQKGQEGSQQGGDAGQVAQAGTSQPGGASGGSVQPEENADQTSAKQAEGAQRREAGDMQNVGDQGTADPDTEAETHRLVNTQPPEENAPAPEQPEHPTITLHQSKLGLDPVDRMTFVGPVNVRNEDVDVPEEFQLAEDEEQEIEGDTVDVFQVLAAGGGMALRFDDKTIVLNPDQARAFSGQAGGALNNLVR